MDLKLTVVKNKTNKQMNFSIPKKLLGKEMVKSIDKNKYIKLKIMKQ